MRISIDKILAPTLFILLSTALVGCDGDTGNADENQDPTITLNGQTIISLQQDEAYVELGATGSDPEDGDISDNILIDNSNLNTGQIGNYQITYNLRDSGGQTADEVVRTVDVVDTNPTNQVPSIVLIGKPTLNVLLNASYDELGATGSDPEDGNISNSIVINNNALDMSTLGTYQITYNLSDSMGLAASQVVRNVNVISTPVENQAPSIALIGAASVSLRQNTAYQELGATGSDPEDGDISTHITIDSSAVNTKTIGTYNVRYSLTDSQELEAPIVIRSVTVTSANSSAGRGYDCDLSVYDYCEDTRLRVSVEPVQGRGADRTAVFNWGLSSNGSPVKMGQFANGDYWVAPADNQTAVTVTSLSGSSNIPIPLQDAG